MENSNGGTMRRDGHDDQLVRILVGGARDCAIFTLDPAGRFTDWNAGARRLFGYEHDEIIGQHFGHIFAADERHAGTPDGDLKLAFHEGQVVSQRSYAHRDSQAFSGRCALLALWDGEFQGYGCLIHNASNHNAERPALHKSNGHDDSSFEHWKKLCERKDKFVAVLTYELRNTLAPIVTALQIIEMQSLEDPIQREAIAVAKRQSQRLSQLLDDVFEASRLTVGKFNIRKELTDVRFIVERVIESARSFIDEARQEFLITLCDAPLWLEADPLRLEQVFLNLLRNASKYTPKGGSICLQLKRENNDAVFQLRDDGCGISPELLPHIFQLFSQAEPGEHRSSGRGLGIGLALVKSFVEMHGGEVLAHSDGPGHGSEFIVRIPGLVSSPIQNSNGKASAPDSSAMRPK